MTQDAPHEPQSSKRRQRTFIAIGLVVVALGALAIVAVPKLLPIEGSMPTEEQALAVHADIIAWHQAGADTDNLPATVADLEPLHVSVDDQGVLIVYKKWFVEDYGFYHCLADTFPPPDVQVFCLRIQLSVYRYYNPG